MNTKMTVLILGAALIIVALIVGGVQLLHVYNIYGAGSNRWYFYGAVGAVGLIGIILAAWGWLKKEMPTQNNP